MSNEHAEYNPRIHTSNHGPKQAGSPAEQFECGDGIPGLVLTDQKPLSGRTGCGLNQGPGISAKQFALAMTVLGQLLLGLAVLAGGSALIGLLAAVVLMACGLTLIAVEAMGTTD